MSKFKPWYTSKSIWGSIVAVIAVIASAFGLEIDEHSQSLIVDAALQMVAISASLFSVLGRLNATSRIE